MQRLIVEASQMTEEMDSLGVTVDANSMSFDNIINAISVMQEHLKISGTTAKEASGTIEGSINSLKAAWDNFLAGTLDGESLAEIAYDAMNNIFNAFMQIIPRLAAELPVFLELVGGYGLELAQKLISTIAERTPDFLAKGQELILNLARGFQDGIPNFLAKALPMIQDFTANLRTNASKFIDSGIEFIKNLMQGLMNSLPTLIQYLPTIISNIVNVINDNFPKILKLGLDLILMLLKGIVQAIPTLIAEFPKILRMILDIWTAFDWLNIGRMVMNGISNGVRALASSVPDTLRNIGRNAWNAFNNINWGDIGWNIVRGIANGIWDGADRIVRAAKDVAKQALNAAKSFLGIHSPSRVFREEVGAQIPAGEAQGIIENADMVEDAAEEVAERALDASMDVNYNLPNTDSVSKDIGASFSSRVLNTVNRVIEVPLNLNGREIARATAWDMGEQLAWESR